MDPQEKGNNSNQFTDIVERLKPANNVLVTVNNNPTVDQLAACIGLTLVLNKLGKHATAVFSGEIPSTIDFLQPEKTIEKNTDSLRDFIIALDKSKADKLRYKVEDQVVKIFITPYKVSINEDDLEFSQGDFNVDAIVALGVQDKAQLDASILAHGRILHDAAVMSLNTTTGSKIGSLAWTEPRASSLCEMVGDISRELSQTVFDSQISTALLTGIVAETDRFSNEKASPHTMSISGLLMAAGASAQLVTTKLEEATNKVTTASIAEQDDEHAEKKDNNGLIHIEHDKNEASATDKDQAESNPPTPVFEEDTEINEEPKAPNETTGPKVVKDPPRLGGQLTANSVPEYQQYTDTTDPLSKSDDHGPILSRQDDGDEEYFPSVDLDDSKTLAEIEEEVGSPHLGQTPTEEEKTSPSLDSVRDAVAQVENEIYRPEPIDSLGAQQLGPELNHEESSDAPGEGEGNGSVPPPPPVPPPIMPPS